MLAEYSCSYERCYLLGSNQGPSAFQTDALPTELRQRVEAVAYPQPSMGDPYRLFGLSGSGRIRTDIRQLAKLLLCHWSYRPWGGAGNRTPCFGSHPSPRTHRYPNAARPGFEPGTFGLTGRCTTELCYLAKALTYRVPTCREQIQYVSVARDEGFEPTFRGPKPRVLPLHQSRTETWVTNGGDKLGGSINCQNPGPVVPPQGIEPCSAD